MSTERQEHYRDLLEALAEEVNTFLKKSKDASEAVELDTSIGRLSRMEAMQDQQMALELRRRKKRQLARVNNALRRLDEGAYGLCELCGGSISEERLEAFPDMMTCVNCA